MYMPRRVPSFSLYYDLAGLYFGYGGIKDLFLVEIGKIHELHVVTSFVNFGTRGLYL